MTSNILKAYGVDIDTRTNKYGNQRFFPEGYKVNAHEVRPGEIYKDSNITVTALLPNTLWIATDTGLTPKTEAL